jgi:probable rRNA maturation factor
MVNVVISSDPRYKINKSAIEFSVNNVLSKHGVIGDAEVEVTIVGDRKMRELNKKYRQLENTTDVLSFCFAEPGSTGFISAPDKILRLGLIVISFPQAVLNASEEEKPVEDEINFLVEHGCTHLLGIHHD